MYFLLTLFFGSLLGIIFMVGRKLVLLQNGQVLHREEIVIGAPSLEKWKHLTITSVKKHGYTGLVATIRFYVRSTNFLKNKYQEVKTKVKSINGKKLREEEKREVSGFLKMISEYKQKIRNIKDKVKEEENL
jgi:hypothetical protein